MKIVLCFLVFFVSLNEIATASLSDGLIGHWTFDGNADDLSGNDHHGTNYGATLTSGHNGNPDSAYSFNGNSYISIPDSDSFTFGSESFTISTWMKFSETGSYYMMGHDEGPGTTNKWIFWPSTSGIIFHVNTQSGGAFSPITYSNWETTLETWYHLSVVRDGNNYFIYINGEEVNSSIDTRGIPNPNAALIFGDAESQHTERNFRGALDDIRIYNRALSSDEILDLYTIAEPTTVGLKEFSLLASYWQITGCDETQPCSAADWYIDGTIDLLDLNQLAMSWLGEEMITDGPISRHVFEIEMSLSSDYGEGYGSSVPVEYQFDAWMRVDDTVVSGTVETPEGIVYPAEMDVDDDENWLGIGEWSASLGGLSDFTDGDYIFTVTYANGQSQSTTVPFETQDGSPLTVPPRPVMTAPVHGATGVPLITNFLLDPSNMTNPVWTYGLEYFPTDDDSSALSGEFDNLPNTTTTVGPVDLSSNTEYEIELTANHAVWSTNNDGIPYVVDKDSEVEIIFTTGSVSYLDDFNDNAMGSLWTLMASDESDFWLDETSQRLEVRAASTSDNDVALYIPNAWHLDTSQDFGFKVRYHNEVVSATWSELLFALGDPEDIKDNHLQFSVCSVDDMGYSGSLFYYDFIEDGSEIDDLYVTRESTDGWIFVSYDTALDELYFGIGGYGPTNAVKTVAGLLQGNWAGKHIAPHIGGSSDHVEMLSGQAYWDDLRFDYGAVIEE